jgi:hypothetical protein
MHIILRRSPVKDFQSPKRSLKQIFFEQAQLFLKSHDGPTNPGTTNLSSVAVHYHLKKTVCILRRHLEQAYPLHVEHNSKVNTML